MSYYNKPSDPYVEIPEEARRKDLMGERFDYEAMIPPAPLTYQGRFIVTCLRCPRSIKRLYVIVYNMHSWPMRVIEHRGWFRDEVIYARPATDREVEEEAAVVRVRFAESRTGACSHAMGKSQSACGSARGLSE